MISGAAGYTAVDAFKAFYRLKELKRDVRIVWEHIDFMSVPTAPTAYTIGEVNADPITLNANLGMYTNFVNLLDLCAVAIPNGFYANGLPIGMTLLAPAFQEGFLCAVAEEFISGEG